MIIEDTWRRLSSRLADQGLPIGAIANMKEAFVAGVYAASASIIAEGAASRDISEAAHRVEQKR